AYPFPRNYASYIDGGVWANCPVMVGLIEAVTWLGKHANELDILSVGTTTEPFYIAARRRAGGILRWNSGVLDVLMFAQVESALAQAGLLTEGGIHRINFLAYPGQFTLDDAAQIPDLIAIGDGEARRREHLDVVRERFLNETPVERFVPCSGAEGSPGVG